MSNYLDQFTDEEKPHVRQVFDIAYVWRDDNVSHAIGPRQMADRVADECGRLMKCSFDQDRLALYGKVIATVDGAEDLMEETRARIDAAWQSVAAYKLAHPTKKKAVPPTEKQLNYLVKLGGKDVPKTKQEASRMIDDLLHK